MKRMLCVLSTLLVVCLAAAACAQEIKTYTFGGSKRDWLTDLAVSADGRIALTGWTESSDGTLKNRTKTGRSGWLLVIDADGNELVNFCTRLGNHDHLSEPVFHDDGSLTAMLFAEDVNIGWVKHEMLRFGRGGDVLSRKVVAEKSAKQEHHISLAGHNALGYILKEQSFRGEGYTHYDLAAYEGDIVKRLDGWHQVYAVADGHVMDMDEPEGKAMYLYRGGAENREKLAQVFRFRADDKRPLLYEGFLSLEDGGAAGCGWVLDESGEEERVGLFTRWDARGSIVSEMRTPALSYGNMTTRPGGFAATACPWDENGWENDWIQMLVLLDENGVMETTIPLASDAVNTGFPACVGALEDGTIVTAHVVKGRDDDTVVTIVKP